MKKNILVGILVLSLLAATPALAISSATFVSSSAKKAKTEKWQAVKDKIEDKKEEQKEKRGEKKEEEKKEKSELKNASENKQAVIIRGELTQIKGISLPTKLAVKVTEAKLEKKTSTSTLPTVNQNITVKVDDKTNFVRKFWGKNSVEELTVGDKVMVVAKLNSDGTYQGLMVKDESIYFKRKFIAGTVNTTSSSTVNIKVGVKDVVVKVDGDTKIIKSGVTSTTLADLATGDKVLVKGVYNTQDDSILARVIRTVKDRIWSLFKTK